MTGNYSRHYFSYTAPEGEAQAGAYMSLRLLSEETMQMQAGDAAPETWHRCNLNV